MLPRLAFMLSLMALVYAASSGGDAAAQGACTDPNTGILSSQCRSSLNLTIDRTEYAVGEVLTACIDPNPPGFVDFVLVVGTMIRDGTELTYVEGRECLGIPVLLPPGQASISARLHVRGVRAAVARADFTVF
jgi:hypothetical protein